VVGVAVPFLSPLRHEHSGKTALPFFFPCCTGTEKFDTCQDSLPFPLFPADIRYWWRKDENSFFFFFFFLPRRRLRPPPFPFSREEKENLEIFSLMREKCLFPLSLRDFSPLKQKKREDSSKEVSFLFSPPSPFPAALERGKRRRVGWFFFFFFFSSPKWRITYPLFFHADARGG